MIDDKTFEAEIEKLADNYTKDCQHGPLVRSAFWNGYKDGAAAAKSLLEKHFKPLIIVNDPEAEKFLASNSYLDHIKMLNKDISALRSAKLSKEMYCDQIEKEFRQENNWLKEQITTLTAQLEECKRGLEKISTGKGRSGTPHHEANLARETLELVREMGNK